MFSIDAIHHEETNLVQNGQTHLNCDDESIADGSSDEMCPNKSHAIARLSGILVSGYAPIRKVFAVVEKQIVSSGVHHAFGSMQDCTRVHRSPHEFVVRHVAACALNNQLAVFGVASIVWSEVNEVSTTRLVTTKFLEYRVVEDPTSKTNRFDMIAWNKRSINRQSRGDFLLRFRERHNFSDLMAFVQ